eukprot:CAMPEP_0116129372 /NCGR_PEP_ID=MMETSP0329-20121206/7890_1 /TAXON_ID=697910 /ORGANISM="Pseudo-nitzschia arenysensis, Strain B593" /LENGTH=306 /DNA_ID=CAMNT_0003623637 /DNA_START=277 /DNA_END=1193 /DNA_ORIENTATION=+
MQCINFYCDLFIMIAVVFYLALVYVIYIFPFRSRFVFFLIALAIANAIFNLFIRGPATTTAVNNAKRICEEETSRINLRSGHGNAISILFHYTKRKCCNCEGYEFDRNEEQRYHDIYVGITLQSERYAGEATATLVDDLYGGTPIATATEVTTATEIPVRRGQRPYRPSAPFTNERADARNTPYVTIPPPPMATAEIVGTTEDDDEEAANTSTINTERVRFNPILRQEVKAMRLCANKVAKFYSCHVQSLLAAVSSVAKRNSVESLFVTVCAPIHEIITASEVSLRNIISLLPMNRKKSPFFNARR